MTSSTRRWLLQLAVAALVTVVFTSQVYVWVNLWPMTVSWWSALLWSIPQLLIWGLSIPLVLKLARRLPLEGLRRPGRFVLHLALSVAYAFGVLVVLDLSDAILRWSYLIGAPGSLVADLDKTIIYLHMGMAVYWVVLAADHARHYYGEVRARELQATRLEGQLARAELNALRMQLQPHFLFNTMNAITVLMRSDPAQAEHMVHRLSDFLRVTLDGDGSQEVPLEEELAYLRSYLAIEEARFGDRLTVHFDVADDATAGLVPGLILQPLVENAVRYGIAARAAPGTVGIRVRREGPHLDLMVWDDGPGITSEAPDEGVGLSNTRQRLTTLYGAGHTLTVANRPEGGLAVAMRLPWRTTTSETP
jgi:signal transduction histidine kinase